ncbi:HECT domain-containing family protein [Cryptosporidium serpentis]
MSIIVKDPYYNSSGISKIRYVNSFKLYSRLKYTKFTLCEISDYIMLSGTLGIIEDIEDKRDYERQNVISFLINASLRRDLNDDLEKKIRKQNISKTIIATDPVDGNVEYFKYFLNNELWIHFTNIFDNDNEELINSIKEISKQMIKVLNLNNVGFGKFSTGIRRYSEVLNLNYFENKMEMVNDNFKSMSILDTNPESIFFPSTLIKLRNFICDLTSEINCKLFDTVGSSLYGIIGACDKLMKKNPNLLYIPNIKYSSLLTDNYYEKSDKIKDIGYILELISRSLDNILPLSLAEESEHRKDLKSNFFKLMSLTSNDFSIEIFNEIVNCSLRLILITGSIEMLLLLLQKLHDYCNFNEGTKKLRLDSVVWNSYQIMALIAPCQVHICNKINYPTKKASEIGVPVQGVIIKSGIPIFGNHIVQFYITTDSMFQNNNAKTDIVRSRIEFAITSNNALDWYTKQHPHGSTLLFDTTIGGSKKLFGRMLSIEICDSAIYIFQGINTERNMNSDFELYSKREMYNDQELKSSSPMHIHYLSSPTDIFLVELVISYDKKTYFNCINIYINGEFIFKMNIPSNLYESPLLLRTSKLLIQTTTSKSTYFEMPSYHILSKNVINDILVPNKLIDRFQFSNMDYNCYIELGTSHLMFFLCNIWNTLISKYIRYNKDGNLSHIKELDIRKLFNKEELYSCKNPWYTWLYVDSLDSFKAFLCLIQSILNNITQKQKENIEIEEYQIDLLVCLLCILKYIMIDTKDTLYRCLSMSSQTGSGVYSNISETIELLFNILMRCISLKFLNNECIFNKIKYINKECSINTEYNDDINCIEWLVHISAIRCFCNISKNLLYFVFRCVNIQTTISYFELLLNIPHDEAKEVLHLFHHFANGEIFILLITRLMMESTNDSNNSSNCSLFINFLNKLILTSTDISKFGIIRESVDNIYKLNLSTSFEQELVDFREKYNKTFWYDICGISDISNMIIPVPYYIPYDGNIMVANTLSSIYICYGITIAQNMLSECFLSEKSSNLLRENNDNIDDTNYYNEEVFSNNKESESNTEYIPNNSNIELSSSSLRKVYESCEINDNGNIHENVNLHHLIKNNLSIIDVVKSKNKDYMKDVNFKYWLDSIYEILSMVISNCSDLIYNTKNKLDNEELHINGDLYHNETLKYFINNCELNDIIERNEYITSGKYRSPESFWCTYYIRYSVIIAISGIIKFGELPSIIYNEYIINKDLKNFKISSKNKSNEYLYSAINITQQCVINLYLKLWNPIMNLNVKISNYLKDTYPSAVCSLFQFKDNILHPLLDNYIAYNWLISQMFIWSFIDIPKYLKNHLEFILESNDSELIYINPIIYDHVSEDYKELKSDVIDSRFYYNLIDERNWLDILFEQVNNFRFNQDKNQNIDGYSYLINSNNIYSNSSYSSHFEADLNFIFEVFNCNQEVLKSISGKYWRQFHPNFINVQCAIYATILYLFGYIGDNIDKEKINNNFDCQIYSNQNNHEILMLASSISQKCCSRLLSKWQLLNENNNNQDNLDYNETINKRNEFLQSVINRCYWILKNIPFNICSIGCKKFQYINTMDYAYDTDNTINHINPNILHNRRASDTDIYKNKFKYDDSNNKSNNKDCILSNEDNQMDLNNINSKNSGLNNIFNWHHMDILRQLLSKRRQSLINKSNQKILSNSNTNQYNIYNDIYGMSRDFRIHSDPIILSVRNVNKIDNLNISYNFSEDIEYDELQIILPLDKMDILNIYLDFILYGPKEINELDMIVKSEKLASFFRLLTLQTILGIISSNSDTNMDINKLNDITYLESWQNKNKMNSFSEICSLLYIRQCGWLYIRLLHMITINYNMIRPLIYDMRSEHKSNQDNFKIENNKQVLPYNTKFIDLYMYIQPYSLQILSLFEKIINQFKKWLFNNVIIALNNSRLSNSDLNNISLNSANIGNFSSVYSAHSSFSDSIIYNSIISTDEFWLDSILRVLILYFVLRNKPCILNNEKDNIYNNGELLMFKHLLDFVLPEINKYIEDGA